MSHSKTISPDRISTHLTDIPTILSTEASSNSSAAGESDEKAVSAARFASQCAAVHVQSFISAVPSAYRVSNHDAVATTNDESL
jgi:hypothetical protein